MEHIWSLIGMLAAVVAILFAAHFVTKWIALQGTPHIASPRGDGRLRVLDRISLGRDCQAVVLQMGDRCLLLGVAPTGVSLLRELDEEETARWTGREEQENVAPPSFLEALQRNWPKKK